MTTPKRAADHYRKGNLESARVILERIAQYGGEEAALVMWARTVLDRATGPLFAAQAAVRK